MFRLEAPTDFIVFRKKAENSISAGYRRSLRTASPPLQAMFWDVKQDPFPAEMAAFVETDLGQRMSTYWTRVGFECLQQQAGVMSQCMTRPLWGT